MKNNFDNRDFEQFVKQNADQYRMFPSEKVWKNINSTLHTRRRWYGIGFASLLLTTIAVTWVMLSHSGKKQQISSASLPTAIAKNTIAVQTTPEVIIATPTKSISNKPAFIASPGNQEKNLFLADVAVVVSGDGSKNDIVTVPQNNTDPVVAPEKTDQLSHPVKSASSYSNKEITVFIPVTSNVNSVSEPKASNIAAYENKNTEPATNESKTPVEKIREIYPLTIESVVNSYKNTRKRKKLSWQVYVTPAISYRKLNENKDFLNAVRSNALTFSSTSYADINRVVTHKPNIGIQLGFSAGYPVSKKIKISAGLQFNVSKYDIRAYSYHTEIATIALNTGNNLTNWVSTYSNYRNFGGYKPDWLHNLSISASAPFGAELQLTANKKRYLGIGSTIQPTYILADKSYLISTDYQHYSEVPSLTRKWNVSSSFEIFAGNSTGKINWRIGPQVRYQMLSSYKGKYPVKEHLFDFGLKLGLMLNK